ncbi:DNA-binding response regulator [Aureimonas sp. SA4125]|uniref:response regulator transcription factor n=1 Tax=Aureimonas sp. SA4125 TaxID=2826993 RepID=UPI001CC360B2|nr:response regulator [Aureimonas sp. SA4125]BDA85245.1 DNA-binding response regulator [Aureimonas sp. SA4125]
MVEACRVHVVDDDASARLSLCAFLKAHGFEAVGHATAEAFLTDMTSETGLCVFVDLRMPGLGGLELQKLMQDSGRTLPVIILTAYGDIPQAVEAVKRGALDFIEKPGNETQLLAAISAAASLAAHRPPTAVPHRVVSQRLARLTGREKEVLDHLVLGMTSKHIADQLGISQRTVEIHRSRIREKMEARGLSDLIGMMR